MLERPMLARRPGPLLATLAVVGQCPGAAVMPDARRPVVVDSADVAFLAIYKGRVAAMIREIGRDAEIPPDRLAIRLVLVERRAAWCHVTVAMPCAITTAADDLGQHPAGGWAGQRCC